MFILFAKDWKETLFYWFRLKVPFAQSDMKLFLIFMLDWMEIPLEKLYDKTYNFFRNYACLWYWIRELTNPTIHILSVFLKQTLRLKPLRRLNANGRTKHNQLKQMHPNQFVRFIIALRFLGEMVKSKCIRPDNTLSPGKAFFTFISLGPRQSRVSWLLYYNFTVIAIFQFL